MADITMCSGVNCPVKEKCYRFTANKCEYGQSFFFSPPLKTIYNTLICEMFWGENSEQIFNNLKNIMK